MSRSHSFFSPTDSKECVESKNDSALSQEELSLPFIVKNYCLSRKMSQQQDSDIFTMIKIIIKAMQALDLQRETIYQLSIAPSTSNELHEALITLNIMHNDINYGANELSHEITPKIARANRLIDSLLSKPSNTFTENNRIERINRIIEILKAGKSEHTFLTFIEKMSGLIAHIEKINSHSSTKTAQIFEGILSLKKDFVAAEKKCKRYLTVSPTISPEKQKDLAKDLCTSDGLECLLIATSDVQKSMNSLRVAAQVSMAVTCQPHHEIYQSPSCLPM